MAVDIARLNLRMCDYAIARFNAMGATESGLYNYYERLASKSKMLRAEEIAIAEYIDRTFPKHTAILELCAGAAQLGHLLSLMLFEVSAAEIDKRRYEFAAALGVYVGSDCRILRGEWQKLKLDEWKLLITLNAVSTHTEPKDVALIQQHAQRGGECIVRPRQFGSSGISPHIPGLKATEVFEDVYHYRTV